MKKPKNKTPKRLRGSYHHRNSQILRPGARRHAAQLAASQPVKGNLESEPQAPKGKLRRKLKEGQPNPCSKLTTALTEKICGYVASGMSWQDAAALCGIHRNQITLWKAKGDAEGEGPYADFLRAAEQAELEREHEALSFIAKDRDWKARRWLLCNWRPEKYRMTSFSGELVGKDGLPLFPTEQQFNVVLELHQPDQPQEPEPGFRIVKPDGSVDLWVPPQPNGQEP
jgi:hypothetical protein